MQFVHHFNTNPSRSSNKIHFSQSEPRVHVLTLNTVKFNLSVWIISLNVYVVSTRLGEVAGCLILIKPLLDLVIDELDKGIVLKHTKCFKLLNLMQDWCMNPMPMINKLICRGKFSPARTVSVAECYRIRLGPFPPSRRTFCLRSFASASRWRWACPPCRSRCRGRCQPRPCGPYPSSAPGSSGPSPGTGGRSATETRGSWGPRPRFRVLQIVAAASVAWSRPASCWRSARGSAESLGTRRAAAPPSRGCSGDCARRPRTASCASAAWRANAGGQNPDFSWESRKPSRCRVLRCWVRENNLKLQNCEHPRAIILGKSGHKHENLLETSKSLWTKGPRAQLNPSVWLWVECGQGRAGWLAYCADTSSQPSLARAGGLDWVNVSAVMAATANTLHWWSSVIASSIVF